LAEPSLARRSLAEAIATFVLVFAGCGAIVVDHERGQALGAVGIAATFGLAIMVLIYATGHLSGAHINPAVTIAFTIQRHFPVREVFAYVLAQLAGAIAAALVLGLVWSGQPADLGATHPTVGTAAALLYETVLTGILMFVIMAVATDSRAVGAAAALAIGGTVALDALVGGGVTGASMNPARSLGPALAAWSWSDIWIYLLGPVAGAIGGAFVYQLVRGERVVATYGSRAGAVDGQA
jgi:MIP family channel proteins